MKQSTIQQFLLYRYRYAIGYAFFSIALIVMLFLQIAVLPSGLSNAELNSAVASNQLSFNINTLQTTDLPYRIVQHIALDYIDFSAISVRIASLLFGAISGILLFMLLRLWFKKNVALIASVITVTSAPFLLASRSGSPDIMLVFWPVVVLLLATLVSQSVKPTSLYKILLGISVVLSLYTPFMIYFYLSVGIAAAIHPHLRFVVKRYGLAVSSVSLLIAALLLVPLAYMIYIQPQIGIQLLGLPPSLPNIQQYIGNIVDVVANIGSVTERQFGTVITPMFSISVVMLIIFGLIRTVKDIYAARSHLLLVWIALLIPFVATNPGEQLVLFIPLILLMSIGVEALLRAWYGLFPVNPYARLAALVPLTILVVSIVQFNYQRFFTGMTYSSSIAQLYNTDLIELRKHQANLKAPATIIVAADSVAPTRLSIADINGQAVTTVFDSSAMGKVIIADDIVSQLSEADIASLGTPTSVITGSRAQDGLLYRVYR